MLEPETLIVRGGIAALTALSFARLVLQEFNRLVGDIRRNRRNR
jgi:hypothetical protein